LDLENTYIVDPGVNVHGNGHLALKLPYLLAYLAKDPDRTRRAMPPTIEIILRRTITLDHPRWTWEQIVAAVREALQGRGDYAFLAADLLAAESA
jgi:hypothetical protein